MNKIESWFNRQSEDTRDFLVFMSCFGWLLFPLAIITLKFIGVKLH